PDVTVEVERAVGAGGCVSIGGKQVSAGLHLAGQRVTLRIDHQLLHVITADGVLARTLPSPLPPAARARLHGARLAGPPPRARHRPAGWPPPGACPWSPGSSSSPATPTAAKSPPWRSTTTSSASCTMGPSCPPPPDSSSRRSPAAAQAGTPTTRSSTGT